MLSGLMLYTLCLPTLMASQAIPDQYPNSALYSKPVEVIPHVWSAIGATAPPTYENSGHNNNLSFIVTGEGVVVINGGASYLLAKALHHEIKQITDQPVVYVINENAQGHAMLGNSYWADQKVAILAHDSAVQEWEKHGAEALARSKRILKEKSEHTKVVQPSESFTDKKIIKLGDFSIEALWLGLAHSPGDVVVHLPEQKLVIAGDMAFHERLLPIMSDTQTAEWLESWQRFEDLDAVYVIPGHGHPTNIAQVRRYTRDYLIFLRTEIGQILEDGGDLQDAYELDQSAFAHLDTFKELAAQNAGRVFEAMEFE
ncbi:MAG: MBL fold metallo-hydrolase [Gammaproteobacteria bacterium]|nr:MBL fold metallo-hydrolase [Gammaproteobacteria bacterium]